MTFFLLRHGETEGPGGFRGRLDPRLTPKGLAQMHAAIAGEPAWELVVSSPLQRCLLFAQSIADADRTNCLVEPGLRELDFGDWEGHTAAELIEDQAEALGLFWADPYTYTPPNGEPVAAFEARVLAAMRALVSDYSRSRTLIVTHGGVIRLLLARQQGLPRHALLQVEAAYGSLHAFDPHALGL
ncbi:alpha-ribazole phosphatase [Pseudomonas duriflava]|uniref:Alpha-ribazole phosphatase n=1 Tax=Pseudomonas duriflava TaxID=459528 RepID=A0A562QC46_9PSED|nr:histidine phosphatase family protein [Pseudomonas duriflava]TWI53750.1 alpha-ribazole phosphatase [Pseudomonas duriflava]